jgi:hypothetical protein
MFPNEGNKGKINFCSGTAFKNMKIGHLLSDFLNMGKPIELKWNTKNPQEWLEKWQIVAKYGRDWLQKQEKVIWSHKPS